MSKIKIHWNMIDKLRDHPRQGTFRNLLQMLGLHRRLPVAAIDLGIGFECLKKRLNRCNAAIAAADHLNQFMRNRQESERASLKQRAIDDLGSLEPHLGMIFGESRKYDLSSPTEPTDADVGLPAQSPEDKPFINRFEDNGQQ